jgi:adenylate cyclase|tara:strand:+ start:13 stop:1818 length:1806 start_codon:yes stop_codon:yes gene_type:complete
MFMMRRYVFCIIFIHCSLISFSQLTQSKADALLTQLNEFTIDNYVEVREQCNELISFYTKTGEKCKQLNSLIIRSTCESSSGLYKEASATNIEMDRLYKKSKCDSAYLIKILYAKAALKAVLKEPGKSDSIAKRAIGLYNKKWRDEATLIKLYLLRSYGNKSIDLTRPFFEKALELSRQSKNAQMEQKVLINYGSAYAMNGNFESASEYMKLALEVAKREGNLSRLGIIYNNLAGLSSDTEETLKYIDSAIFYAEKTGNLQDHQRYAENKAYFYSLHEDFENGYNQLWVSNVLKDSLLSIKKYEAIADMQEKYEAEKKANEIQALKVEKLSVELNNVKYKRNQIILLIGSLGLLVTLGFLAYNFVNVRRNRNKLAVKNVEISKARKQSDDLLLNILPAEIARELKEKGSAKAKNFDEVSVLFSDFKGFTAASEKLSAQDLVSEINTCFEAFDNIMEKYQIEKIKTIGDAYMAGCGLPVPDAESAKKAVLAGLEMQDFIENRKVEQQKLNLPFFEMRLGIHTGPLVAGIVGIKKFQYDIWGDTVNTASRLESNGVVGKVNISKTTYDFIADDPAFVFEKRGEIEVKGKGLLEMFFVGLKDRA